MNTATATLAWVDRGGESFLPVADLGISIQDIGFRQGVVGVERMRTYRGRPVELPQHLARWRRTLEHLMIRLPTDQAQWSARIDSLIDRNREWCRAVGDFGITMLVTPGLADQPESGPTQMLHFQPLDLAAIERRRTQGQPLVITDVQQPSSRCWPRDIKVRCRLHYYSADSVARQLMPDGLGVLIDADGSITETSVANVIVVRDGQCLVPPTDQVLPGITQNVVRRLVDRLGVPWQHRHLFPADLREATEVWLTGTDGGLWFADRVDGHAVADGRPGGLYLRLLAEFDRYMGAAADRQ